MGAENRWNVTMYSSNVLFFRNEFSFWIFCNIFLYSMLRPIFASFGPKTVENIIKCGISVGTLLKIPFVAVKLRSCRATLWYASLCLLLLAISERAEISNICSISVDFLKYDDYTSVWELFALSFLRKFSKNSAFWATFVVLSCAVVRHCTCTC